MKILIASDSYIQINGVSNSVSLLVHGLREKGHEVKVLTLSPDRKSYKEGDDYFISSVDALVYPDMRISVALYDELIDELVSWKPDIAHIQTEFSAKFLAARVVRKCGIPFVMTSHTDYEEYFKSKKIPPVFARNAIKNFERIIYSKADALIVPSYKIQELMEIYKVKCPVVVIPTGIELSNHPSLRDGREALMKKVGLQNNGKVLVTVSRISKEKNIDELIGFMPALLREDPEITLLVVGGGPYLEKLKEKADALGVADSVIFTDMVPSEEVYKYYRLGDIFVSASTFETQGLTYVEALANELPLVCREDKALINIIDPGKNGFIYTDETEFIAHIMTILGDRDLQKRMSRASVIKSFAFSKEVFVSAVEELYEDVIAGYDGAEFPLEEE